MDAKLRNMESLSLWENEGRFQGTLVTMQSMIVTRPILRWSMGLGDSNESSTSPTKDGGVEEGGKETGGEKEGQSQGGLVLGLPVMIQASIPRQPEASKICLLGFRPLPEV